MLFLVATPIGNLKDFSPRAIETLKASTLILCEDTRHSRPLLQTFAIQAPCQSYHKFSEAAQEAQILQILREEKQVSLITDAGTPGLSDPGQRLVNACHEANIPVSGIPGPCAAVFALALSGFPTEPFQFLGFVPKAQGERLRWLHSFLFYPGTTIHYESPERILSLLSFLHNWIPSRQIAFARELTKKFEEIRRGTAEELHQHLSKSSPKGEFVVLIQGTKEQEKWDFLSAEEHVQWLMEEFPLSLRDAIRLAAEMRGTKKRDLYHLRQNKKSK